MIVANNPLACCRSLDLGPEEAWIMALIQTSCDESYKHLLSQNYIVYA